MTHRIVIEMKGWRMTFDAIESQLDVDGMLQPEDFCTNIMGRKPSRSATLTISKATKIFVERIAPL